MSEIALLCGLPGSGKSTWAADRARRGAMVFDPDQWMIRLYGHHMPREIFDDRLARCYDLIFEHTNRLAQLGVDVVIAGMPWTKSKRLIAADRLASSGARLTLYWFDVPIAELQRRLAGRNAALPPDTFEITEPTLAQFASWFEPPSDEEPFSVVRLA